MEFSIKAITFSGAIQASTIIKVDSLEGTIQISSSHRMDGTITMAVVVAMDNSSSNRIIGQVTLVEDSGTIINHRTNLRIISKILTLLVFSWN